MTSLLSRNFLDKTGRTKLSLTIQHNTRILILHVSSHASYPSPCDPRPLPSSGRARNLAGIPNFTNKILFPRVVLLNRLSPLLPLHTTLSIPSTGKLPPWPFKGTRTWDWRGVLSSQWNDEVNVDNPHVHCVPFDKSGDKIVWSPNPSLTQKICKIRLDSSCPFYEIRL
jgi:hypothetical protein